MYLHDDPQLGRLPRPPHPPGMRHKRRHPRRPIMVAHRSPWELNGYDYDDQQLGGFGKKLKKAVRKVAKVAAVGAALYFAPTLAVSALKAVQARKAAEAQAKAQAEANQRAQAEAAAATAAAISQAQQSSVAAVASPMGLTPSIAPPGGLVARSMNVPTMTSFMPSSDGQPQYTPIPSDGGVPKWLIPAGIGGVGLIALMLLRPKS